MRKLGEMLRIRSKSSVEVSKKVKVAHPIECPKCKSSDIMGYGSIMGYGYINLSDMSVDEPSDEFEVYDDENLEYRCGDCDYSWE